MSEPRRTSEVEGGFPFKSRSLCYFMLKDGKPDWVSGGADEVRAAILWALGDRRRRLYVAWPGQWATHLFRVDNVSEMASAWGVSVKNP